MAGSVSGSEQRTHEEIGSWLVERVAHYVQCPVEEIDPEISVAEVGLDSVYWFTLCGEIEDRFFLSIEPDLVWELDTLAALTTYLAEMISDKTALLEQPVASN